MGLKLDLVHLVDWGLGLHHSSFYSFFGSGVDVWNGFGGLVEGVLVVLIEVLYLVVHALDHCLHVGWVFENLYTSKTRFEKHLLLRVKLSQVDGVEDCLPVVLGFIERTWIA